MYCRFCGKQNRDGAKFCVGCGKPLPVLGEKKTPPPENKSILPIILIIIVLLIALIGGSIFVAVKFFEFELPFVDKNQTVQVEEGDNKEENDNKDNEEEIDLDEDAVSNQEVQEEQMDAADESEQEVKNISSAYADDRHYYGNSFENVSQGGPMVAYGEWIYYSNVNADSTIWKMKADGSEQTQVFSIPAWHISIHNDWLYYRQLDKGYLCRYNLKDGTDEILVKRDIYEPKVVGNYIYYEDASDESYDLYRVDTNGANETKLTDGVVLYCCVTDNRIYYLDTRESRKGYSVNLDGGDKQLWYAGKVGTIDYVDGVLYFTDSDKGGLYTLNPNNGEIKQISNLTMWSINIYDGAVYYADGKNDGALTKTLLSAPNEQQLLSTDKCELINVCGGWVQYHVQGFEENERFYWIPVDGGALRQF